MAKNNLKKHNLNNIHFLICIVLLLFSALARGIHTSAKAVSCLNGGYLDASAVCVCPPGFGGTQCTLPQCGGNAFSSPRPLQNANASVLPGAGGGSIIARRDDDEVLSPLELEPIASTSLALSSRSFLELSTAKAIRDNSNDTCACDDGWTGLGCGVCASSTSCNTGFLATGGFYPSGGSISDGVAARAHNQTLTCNTGPVVVNAGAMSCNVENASYTLASNPSLSIRSNLAVTLIRRPNGALSPVSGLRAAPAYASAAAPLALAVWLDGVQQVSCAVSSCEVVDDRTDDAGDNYEYDEDANEDGTNSTTTMTATGTGTGSGSGANATMKGKVRLSSRWQCSDLSCSCLPGTKYCGGTEEALNLTAQVSSISGDLSLTCPPESSATTNNNNTSVTSCALTSLSPSFRALFNVTHHNSSSSSSSSSSAGKSDSSSSSSSSSIPPILLTSCSFGECIAQNAFDASGFNPAVASSAAPFSIKFSSKAVSGSLVVAILSGLVGAFCV